MDPLEVALITLAAIIVICFLALVAFSGGDFGKLGLACRAFICILRDPNLAGKIRTLLAPPDPKATVRSKIPTEPLRFLALLQREGRLIDFLTEDIQAYDDAQVGAAVREIHQNCQAALKEHLGVAPVLPQDEGSNVEVPPGFDPSAIRVVGNVTGQPPFRGSLRHRGWRVTEVKLAPLPEGQDPLVLQPAEVELP